MKRVWQRRRAELILWVIIFVSLLWDADLAADFQQFSSVVNVIMYLVMSGLGAFAICEFWKRADENVRMLLKVLFYFGLVGQIAKMMTDVIS